MEDTKIIESLIEICRQNSRGEVLTHIAKQLEITTREASSLIEYGKRNGWLVEEKAARYKSVDAESEK